MSPPQAAASLTRSPAPSTAAGERSFWPRTVRPSGPAPSPIPDEPPPPKSRKPAPRLEICSWYATCSDGRPTVCKSTCFGER